MVFVSSDGSACCFNIFYIYQAFILLFHESLHPPSPFSLPLCPSVCLSSLSLVPHPVFLIRGISLRFGDIDVFFLQSKVLCSYTPAVAYPGFFSGCPEPPPPPDHYFFNQGVTPLLAPTLTGHLHLRRSEIPLQTNSGYATDLYSLSSESIQGQFPN